VPELELWANPDMCPSTDCLDGGGFSGFAHSFPGEFLGVVEGGGWGGDHFRAFRYAQSKHHWTLHSVTDSVIKLFKLSGNYMHHLLQPYISVPLDSYNP
jgi:hypothetical protein